MIVLRQLASLTVLSAAVLLAAPGASAQFETRSSTTVASPLSAIAVGDFNRDGKVDFAAADSSLQIFLGDGDGTFGTPQTYLSSVGTIYVTTADFNHDGNLDLAVADLDGLHILIGRGDGDVSGARAVHDTLHPDLCNYGRLQQRPQAGPTRYL